jgi:hypothetical protein
MGGVVLQAPWSLLLTTQTRVPHPAGCGVVNLLGLHKGASVLNLQEGKFYDLVVFVLLYAQSQMFDTKEFAAAVCDANHVAHDGPWGTSFIMIYSLL